MESLSLVNVKYFCTTVMNPHTHMNINCTHAFWDQLPVIEHWKVYGEIGYKYRMCVWISLVGGGGSRLDLHPCQFSENDRPLIILNNLNKISINYKDFCFIKCYDLEFEKSSRVVWWVLCHCSTLHIFQSWRSKWSLKKDLRWIGMKHVIHLMILQNLILILIYAILTTIWLS